MAPPAMPPALAAPPAVWHGTPADRALLEEALVRQCARRPDLAEGTRCYVCRSCLTTTCQAALDRLAFVATLRERLLEEEVAP